jgi:N-acetylmuramoyl-L-alanine amidase
MATPKYTTKIAVYAGHGGYDSGAQSGDLKEKDLNLAVSNTVTAFLRQYGYTVINNRTTDVDRDITKDAQKANENNVNGLVEIHFNSNAGEPGSGTEVFYQIRNTDGLSRTLASAIQTRIVALGFKDRGIKTLANSTGGDYFGILRLTNAPAVLVECAFINNPADMELLDIDKMSRAIADGIREVFPVSEGDILTRSIQKTLNHRYGTGLVIDGLFGPSTRKALIIGLQKELNKTGANLVPDGVFGPLTKAAIVLLYQGSRGYMVYLMQSALYGKNYGICPNGIFDSSTRNTVMAFQRNNGLAADGIAGPQTMEALFKQ